MSSTDLRSLGPIRVCVCGSQWWNVKVMFDEDYEVGQYLTEATCVECNSLATVVTELDKE